MVKFNIRSFIFFFILYEKNKLILQLCKILPFQLSRSFSFFSGLIILSINLSVEAWVQAKRNGLCWIVADQSRRWGSLSSLLWFFSLLHNIFCFRRIFYDNQCNFICCTGESWSVVGLWVFNFLDCSWFSSVRCFCFLWFSHFLPLFCFVTVTGDSWTSLVIITYCNGELTRMNSSQIRLIT